MLSLNSLAGWEDAVLASIAGATGTDEERDRQIERSGLYGEYPAILRAYEELFVDAESIGEAIKRAVFLVWRGAMDVPWRTAIGTLPDGTVRSVISALGTHVRRGLGDDELEWMLAWYHAESPLLFELYGAPREVIEAAERQDPDAWRRAKIDVTSMARRGQMGRYWSALASE